MIIKGNDMEKPVLLFLSGGAGIPEYFLEYQYSTFLENEFIVCFWDWRGTGLSYEKFVTPESMTRQQFIADTKSGINPNVNVIPALSHASAGNIALGFATVVL